MLRKLFVAMLLLVILIVTSGEGKTATQKQYEGVTVDIKRAVDKRVDEMTTLTNAYIDPNDERKAVFVSTLSVDKDDIDEKKWEDLGESCAIRLVRITCSRTASSIATCACSTATLTNAVKLSVSFSSTIADRFNLRPLSTAVTLEPRRIAPLPPIGPTG